MFRAVLSAALICVLLSIASASSESVELAKIDRHTPPKRCNDKYCWKRKRDSPKSREIQMEKCGGTKWPYVKWCDKKDISKGWTCHCPGKKPTPKPTTRPPRPTKGPPRPTKRPPTPTKDPYPTKNPSPPKKVSCGSFVLSPPGIYDDVSYYVNVERTWGFFEFTWGAYVIKDKFVISQGGSRIFDSDYVMGTGMNRVFLNGIGKTVMVTVVPSDIGSIWDFIAGCAKI